MQFVKPRTSLTVVGVLSANCIGCFLVNLTDKDHKQESILLDKWKAVEDSQNQIPETLQLTSMKNYETEIILTKEQCNSKQGKVRGSESGCYDLEFIVGKIRGSEDVEVCCVSK